MPGITRNSFTQGFPQWGFVAGSITGAASTPAFTGIGSSLAAGDISVTDNGTGDYSLVIANFQGNKGTAYGFGNAQTLGNFVCPVAYSYSGTTLTLRFKVSDAAGAAADDTINVQVWAA